LQSLYFRPETFDFCIASGLKGHDPLRQFSDLRRPFLRAEGIANLADVPAPAGGRMLP